MADADDELPAQEAKAEVAPAQSTEVKLDELPSRLTAVADAAKHRWDPLNSGELSTGSGCFRGALGLTLGDDAFKPEEAWEDTANATYRIRGSSGGLKIERRILVDRQLGAARYLDIFHNTTNDDLDLAVGYAVGLAYPAKMIYTSRGRQLSAKLGSRDFGIAIEAPADAGVPGVMLVLAHERSPLKPQIAVSGGRDSIGLRYRLPVKAGHKAALLTWIAQQEFQGGDGLETQFARFYAGRRLVAPAVAEPHLELIANFPGDYDALSGGAEYLVAVDQLADRLGLDRERGVDLMRVENGSVLTGDATGDLVRIASRFGDIEVPKAKLAVLEGGAGRGRTPKVYLRDGSVYAGAVSVDGLGLQGGFDVSLGIGQLDHLLYRLSEIDGEFPAGTGVFMQLHSGDVLPIGVAQSQLLGLVSPWGRLEVPLTEIAWMRYVQEPSPRYRVSLVDGSMLTVFLDPREMVLTAGGLGEVRFGATELRAMWGAEVELPKGFQSEREVAEIGEIPTSMAAGACLLAGDNLVVGELAGEELHISTGATVTVVKLADVVRMERSGDGLEPSPVFEIELASGDKIEGVLQEGDLQVQAGSHLLRVPVQHFIATRSSGAQPRADAGSSDAAVSPAEPGRSRVSGRRAVIPQNVPEP